MRDMDVLVRCVGGCPEPTADHGFPTAGANSEVMTALAWCPTST
jgi:hypothetical protein